MKLLEFHARIIKNNENLNIPGQNHENYGIPRIPVQNNENHEKKSITR